MPRVLDDGQVHYSVFQADNDLRCRPQNRSEATQSVFNLVKISFGKSNADEGHPVWFYSAKKSISG